ncbi:MAG: ImmA/IrrE family metallo-endopeptidase [Candidatus Omnitrophica bacterium]|nr:ImmA/IrrE family metallo-endopeptidase [Candidatus Omnitrophota bacterium]
MKVCPFLRSFGIVDIIPTLGNIGIFWYSGKYSLHPQCVARLRDDNGKNIFIIYYNSLLPLNEQLFGLLHEIGHIIFWKRKLKASHRMREMVCDDMASIISWLLDFKK